MVEREHCRLLFICTFYSSRCFSDYENCEIFRRWLLKGLTREDIGEKNKR